MTKVSKVLNLVVAVTKYTIYSTSILVYNLPSTFIFRCVNVTAMFKEVGHIVMYEQF
jgi:hypothetical protein